MISTEYTVELNKLSQILDMATVSVTALLCSISQEYMSHKEALGVLLPLLHSFHLLR